MDPEVYAFGEYEIDLRRAQLRRRGSAVPLEAAVFDLLGYLVRNRDRLVPKVELLDEGWGHRFVGDSELAARIGEVRVAVGDDGGAEEVIRSVRGRGYQFVAPVRTPAPEPQRPAGQDIRYCSTPDGVRIAYATSGQGPPLVKAANWLTHIDLEWDSAVWGHRLAGLSRHHTLVRYDERGCGLSDWEVGDFTFDDWVEDLKVVADAAGLDRFPLLGISQGGAVAVAFAVAYPERVSRLVLVGAYGRGRLVRAGSDAEREEAALDVDLARVAWRRDDDTFRQVFASQFLPDAGPEQRAAFNELQRLTTSADNAARFIELFAEIDVSHLLPRVSVPTLVIHSRHDRRVPTEQARELAGAIPGSRLVMLPSGNHLLTADEPAWPQLLAEVEAFLEQ